MPETPAFERDPAATPEIHLAECWADVTKALAVYPDSNERVQSKLTELIEAAQGVLTAVRGEAGADLERGIGILFQEEHVFVGSMEHTFEPGSTLAWLRTRLDRSALAGIELMPDLTMESFTAFTRQLLDNFLQKDGELTFEALWTELYDGVVLIDRRFEGTFGGLAALGKFAGGHGGSASGDTRHFITGLLMHPKVRKRIARIGELGSADEETSEASGLLRDVLDDVPADALKSRDVLINWVCSRLDDLADRVIGSGKGAPGSAAGERFASLLRQVSSQHFAREGPNLDRIKTGAIVETKPGGGRARDAEITDDVESLVSEVQELPETVVMHLGAEDHAAAPEQIAVILHFAVHLQRPEELPGQTRLLGELLSNPGPAELAVIRQYLAWDDDGDGTTAASMTAVIRVLDAVGRTQLLRTCGALSPDLVVQTFPDHFGHFLGALDLDLDHDRAELDDVLTRVGPQQFLNASAKVLPAVEKLQREGVQRLLEEPKACRLPLIRLLLEGPEKTAVSAAAEFLRELDLPEAEAFLLSTIRPLALLTPEYLIGLIDVHLRRTTSFSLRTPVSDVLCRHIIAVGDADPLDRSRLESIRLLARYPSTRGELMLKTLRKFGLGVFRRGEPPPVRRLARSLLKNWQAA